MTLEPRSMPQQSTFWPRTRRARAAPRDPALLEAWVRTACLRVSNPLRGYLEHDFFAAQRPLCQSLHADLLPSHAQLAALFWRGRFGAQDVQLAAAQLNADADPALHVDAPALVAALRELRPARAGCEGPRVLSVAGRLDRVLHTSFERDIAALCAGLLERGLTSGPYAAFRAAAVSDHGLAARGVDGFAALARDLPEDCGEALRELLGQVSLDDCALLDYLCRLLAEVRGCVGALRAGRGAHDPEDLGPVRELLAIRLAYDVALVRSRRLAGCGVPRAPFSEPEGDGYAADARARQVLLLAAESALRRELTRALCPRARRGCQLPPDLDETPEQGLANHAVFIAARPARTRGVPLHARALVHGYDRTLDPDGSALEQILTAPLVAASGTNLQHLAAEPVRLQAIIEDTPERILAVLDRHRTVRALVEHGYVVLHALDPDGDGLQQYVPGSGFVEASPEARQRA